MKNQSVNRLVLIFLIVGLFLLFFLPPFDPDLGWQLRCGQQIWQQKELCTVNTFSVFLENYRWTDARAFYQALIFPFYPWFGLLGLSLINGLLMATAFFFWLSLAGKKEIKVILLPLIIFFSWLVLGFGIRNQLISLFFLLLLLKVIEQVHQGKRGWFFLLPLVMFFWANSHGGFVLGVFLLLAFLLEKTIEFMTKKESFKNYLFLFGWLIFSLLATFINPFGFKIYFEAWRHFSVVPLSRLIAEWVPPPFGWQIMVFLFLGLALGVIYQARKKSLTLFKLLGLFFLAFLALKARRDLVFFFFFAGYVLSSFKLKKTDLQALTLLISMAIFVLGFLLQFPRTIMIDGNWEKFCSSAKTRYPAQAVEFLRKQPAKGRIFNAYEWGGFLIWQLPEYKVFVDGRMPAWQTASSKSPYTIYLETLQTQPGWQATLTEFKIDWLFIYPGTFMDLKIKDKPEDFGWQEVYRDELAVIYQKI
ncbi:MAG: hypothetical protein MUP45_01735 [Candidatus Marinimicrobia bacterium]|nr:hypothetical protein [Candidatus Neomarinimicrobiota bacterium]